MTQIGSLEALTADCYIEVEGKKGPLDLSNIEDAEVFDAGQMGGMTNEDTEVVALDGVVCECCTQCF